MIINSFELLVKTERSATRYITMHCWEKQRRFCIRCKNGKISAIRRQRYRCKSCKYEFSDRTGRWIGQLNISAKNWLWIVKLFELEISAERASRQLSLCYPTVLKAFEVIRQSFFSLNHEQTPMPKNRMDAAVSEFSIPVRGVHLPDYAGKIPVFGILERDGIAHVEWIPDITPETLLNTSIQQVKRGSIIYTDQFRGFDALIFYAGRSSKKEPSKPISSAKIYIDGLKGFWTFAKDKLINHPGLRRSYFPSYLKELEFRYNHRHVSLFELMIKALCRPVSTFE